MLFWTRGRNFCTQSLRPPYTPSDPQFQLVTPVTPRGSILTPLRTTEIEGTPSEIIGWIEGSKQWQQILDWLKLECSIALSITSNQVFHMCHHGDKQVPIPKGFIFFTPLGNKSKSITMSNHWNTHVLKGLKVVHALFFRFVWKSCSHFDNSV